MVNNAGTGVRGHIWETEIKHDLETIHLNITSLVELTKLVLPEMIKRNDGRILMLGSSASFQPNPLLANYAATKAFIANYTDALIDELKDSQVKATLLVPGPTDTVIFISNLSLFFPLFENLILYVNRSPILLNVDNGQVFPLIPYRIDKLLFPFDMNLCFYKYKKEEGACQIN